MTRTKPNRNAITMTRDLAHSCGWDAGNRSAAEAGRTVWNETDANIAAAITNRCLMMLTLAEGGTRDLTWKHRRKIYVGRDDVVGRFMTFSGLPLRGHLREAA